MKIKWKLLLICIAIPLIGGGIAALISGGGMRAFEDLAKPPLSPPGWLFPVVWTILYTLMGISLYLVLTSGAPQSQITPALILFGLQLLFNFVWPVLFFNFELYYFAFFWLVALWILIVLNAFAFYAISKPAGYLFIPYLLWVTFAGYLNLGIAMLN